jgi:hypothetical protein
MGTSGEGGIRTPGTLLGYNSLAGSPIRPLSHLSNNQYLGEGGIRTHGALRLNGFQDRLLRPLGHLSSLAIRDFTIKNEFFFVNVSALQNFS